MIRSTTRRTFGIKMPMKVGLLDRPWIPSPRRWKLLERREGAPGNSAPGVKMPPSLADSLGGIFRSGNFRLAMPAMERRVATGVWAADWALLRRDCIHNGFRTWMQLAQSFGNQASAKSGFLRSPGQAGYPPSVAADAHLGFSVMAYQSAEVLFGRCLGQGSVPVRVAGSGARAPQGSKKDDITQRAKVGYCPRCARSSHVAAPPRYVVGEFYGHKARGIQLRMDHGP